MFKGLPISKTTYYRRRQKAKRLGLDNIMNLPDLRGKHGNSPRGRKNARWNPTGIQVSKQGYLKVRVGKDHPLADPCGFAYLHTLVWVAAGKPRPERKNELHHKNTDKHDNRLENLECNTKRKHHQIHWRLNPLIHPKLTAFQVISIRRDGRPYREIAMDYDTSRSNVSLIKRGKTWKPSIESGMI